MSKPGVFYFNFFNQDNEKEIWKGFVFTGVKDEQEFFIEIAEERVVDLEDEYGVHDWGTSPNDKVMAFGYGTYEVEETKIDELMNKWRNVFVELLGERNVGPVNEFEYDMSDDDYSIYKKVGGI